MLVSLAVNCYKPNQNKINFKMSELFKWRVAAARGVVGSFGEALSGGGGGGGTTVQDVWEYPERTLVPRGRVTHLY
jgi:hypothetical protein